MGADGKQPAGSLGGSRRIQWELGRSETFYQRAVEVAEGTAAGHPAAPPGAAGTDSTRGYGEQPALLQQTRKGEVTGSFKAL